MVREEELKHQIESVDRLIKSGRIAEARAILSQVEIKKVTRPYAAPFAALARRLQLFQISLRILNPIVRPNNPLAIPATPEEELEYGIVLTKIGALEEGRRILAQLDSNERPAALLFLAMSYFSEWNYSKALPILCDYLTRESLTPYQRSVGQINLAASLVCLGENEEAERLLEALRRDTQQSGARLLYSNCLELSAQLQIELMDFKRARNYLHEALEIVQGSDSISELYARKWMAVCESYQDGALAPAWYQVREQANCRHEWEVVRDCDLHAARVTCDRQRLLHSYFGSPFGSFRERVLRLSPIEFDIPEVYEYREEAWAAQGMPAGSPSESGERGVVIDLEMAAVVGREGDKPASLPVGSHVHAFLILLSSDFYKPVDIASAFCAISPDEYFNPTSSAGRIHQLASRLRKWIEQNQLPLELEAVDGAYRLQIRGSVAIRLPRELPLLTHQDLLFRKLQRSLPKSEFSAKEARLALGVSFGSANSLLKWAIECGKLQKLGAGASTRYFAISSASEFKY